MNPNPQGLNGPNATAPYQQPNTANPADKTSLGVANYPVGRDELNLTQPIPKCTQPT